MYQAVQKLLVGGTQIDTHTHTHIQTDNLISLLSFLESRVTNDECYRRIAVVLVTSQRRESIHMYINFIKATLSCALCMPSFSFLNVVVVCSVQNENL
jgi:hypothetical protein